MSLPYHNCALIMNGLEILIDKFVNTIYEIRRNLL